MPNQQLTGYIKQQLEKGVNGEKIRKILLDTGWAEGDIREAFATIQDPNYAPTPETQAATKSRSSDIGWLIFAGIMVFLAIPFILFVVIFPLQIDTPPTAAKNATIKAYMDQVKSTAAVYDANNGGYTGLETNSEYSLLCRKIEERSGTPCQAQISDNNYCVKAKLLATGKYYDEGSWCVDSNGYSAAIAEDFCTVEKPYCQEPPIKEVEKPSEAQSQTPIPDVIRDMRTKSYLSDIKAIAGVYNNDNSSYVGLEKSSHYSEFCGEIESSGSLCQTQTDKNGFCVKARLNEKIEGSASYWCVDSNGYTGQTNGNNCTAQKISCE